MTTTHKSFTSSITSIILLGVLIFQIGTHLFWLPISAHSGQVAIPWMMNNGYTLFGDLLEQHAPGSSVIAALAQRIVPFEPVVTAQVLNLVLVLGTTLLIYTLARRLSDGDSVTIIASLLIWALWEPVYGNILFYFDSIVGALLLLIVLLWHTLSHNAHRWVAPFAAGLTLGAATLAKQHAYAAVAAFALWLLITRQQRRHHRREWLLYLGGVALLPVLTLIIASSDGTLDNYLYWNWAYNLSGIMPGVAFTGDFLRKILLTNALVPAFMLMALRDFKQRPLGLLIALLWAAGATTIFPRPGEIHVMAHLPLTALMSGLVIGQLRPAFDRANFRQQMMNARIADLTLGGIALSLAVGWLWTGATPYITGPLGRGRIPAYDEFRPLVAQLQALSQPGDTLFILPETDSTPQIHQMSAMLPPQTWIKGWFWYFDAPGIVETLLTEWESAPPDFIVYFPELESAGQPGIEALLMFMREHYEPVAQVDAVVFHGDAVIYRFEE
ncbi:MAG: hypothetical protein D6737_16310 [Chloroflexi bacterium]|nr:MAG: hypothetical protein D6737_16310 [Chloroflexota bacterium]